jgi:hypothetical protein
MELRWRNHVRATAKLSVIRGAESWQFFAFVFAAVVPFEFVWTSELPNVWLRLVAGTTAFILTFYLIMLNPRARNWLVGQLNSRIKPEV